MKILNTIGKKYGIRILIVIVSMLFLCTFLSRKEGYHMDEILAYELANAEYNPWIVPTQPVGRLAKFMEEHIDGKNIFETFSNALFIVEDTLTNRGNSILANYKADVYEAPVWIDRESFQNYVQCNSDDDFNLLSVYFNVKDDNHPPLHFMLLHLMCSIFKGDISAWHGGVINLAAMAVTLWTLGSIGNLILKEKRNSYACMILYGFSTGIVATTIWIRMYALLTCFVTLILYFHICRYKQINQRGFVTVREKDGKEIWIGSQAIFWCTVLSFWTQYFGLFFILPLAVVTCILLLTEKRYREIWSYIRTMASAAVLGVLVYPFAIGDVLFSERGVEAIGQWKNGFSEYMMRLHYFIEILSQNTSVNLICFLLLLILPILGLVWVRMKHKSTGIIKSVDYMFVIPTIIYFLLAAKMSPYFVDRYIMAIFPIVILAMVWLWDTLFAAVFVNQKRILVIASMLVALAQVISMDGTHVYLYEGYQEQLEIAYTYREYPAVCLYDGYGFYENIPEMEQYAESILVKEKELSYMDQERVSVTKDGYISIIKDYSEEAGKEKLEQVMDTFGGTRAEQLFEGGPFGDAIYRITP